MPKNKIRILLADDHPVVREGIRSCLAKHAHLEIVGEAENGWEAVAKAKALLPDLVLLDINMPALNGLQAAAVLRQELPQTKILILTVFNEKEYVLQVARSGAHGYVLKETSPQELVRAIETVYRGTAYFSSEVTQFVLDDYVTKAGQIAPPKPSDLSAREVEVLALIAEGHRNKTIADLLSVSVRTVETHRESIMRKLNLHTVAGLTKYAVAHRIIALD